MKIIVDFNDLTNLIIADLADKGIQVSEQDIEYTENGVEISINNLGAKSVKPIKPKQTRTVKKQEQEPIAEDETEIEEETKNVDGRTETVQVSLKTLSAGTGNNAPKTKGGNNPKPIPTLDLGLTVLK